jgi:uncharacterized protein (DUF2141 family)
MKTNRARTSLLTTAAIAAALILPCTAAAKSPNAAPLHVKASGFTSSDGTAIFAVYPKVPDYPADLGKAVAIKAVKIVDGAAEADFDALQAGKYAVVAVHDVNGNGKLDLKRKGVPAEPLGYFKRGKSTPPSWDDGAVDLQNEQTVNITVF